MVYPNAPLGPTTNIKIAQPKWVVNGALGLLDQELILSNLVYKDASLDFHGSIGEVINVKRPTRSMGSFDIAPFQHNSLVSGDPLRKTRVDAVDRTGFVSDHIEETYIQIKLDTNRGSQHYISDEQLDFDIDQFAAEVLQPQVRGLAEYFEWRLAKDMLAYWGKPGTAANDRVASVVATPLIAAPVTDADFQKNAMYVRNAIIDARKAMDAMSAPKDGRYILATPEIEAILLKDPSFQRVDWSGTDNALRNATIGKLFGLYIVTSNEIAAQTSNGLAMFLLHPTAMVLATKAPAIPKGAVFGSGASANGIGLRWMMDYDSTKMQDRSFLNVYLGTTPVTEDPRWIAFVKARLAKVAPGVTTQAAFDVMRVVRIDLSFAA